MKASILKRTRFELHNLADLRAWRREHASSLGVRLAENSSKWPGMINKALFDNQQECLQQPIMTLNVNAYMFLQIVR